MLKTMILIFVRLIFRRLHIGRMLLPFMNLNHISLKVAINELTTSDKKLELLKVILEQKKFCSFLHQLNASEHKATVSAVLRQVSWLIKSLLENHGLAISEDTILALRIVMDMLNGFGVLLHFQVSKDLLISVKEAREWYHGDLEAKKNCKRKGKSA